jgi:PAS domain S-box-containing protein
MLWSKLLGRKLVTGNKNEHSASDLRDLGDDGRTIGCMDISRDITSRKRAEEALRESEARYRAVSEMISDFVYALNVSPDGAFDCDWITGAFQVVTGYHPNEIDWHKHWLNLIHPDDNSVAQLLALRLLFGYKDEREFRILAKSGEVRWVHHCAQPVWDQAEERVVRIYGAVMDITERKQMEAQIQAVQMRLAQSARLAAIGELASGVAHHINNPLTTIIAESQILLGYFPQDHAVRESAEAIEQAGWRVQKAVQKLLDFSRPASNTIETLSINSTIQSALELVSGQIQSAGIQLEVELPEGLPSLRGNYGQLSDLWVNFLMLARDATSDGLPHTIQIRSKDLLNGSLVVEVSDDGAVIPAEEMAVLFEPNFVKSLGGRGTGIELNICQEIVRQHSGQISAESSIQAGTTFQVCLPVEVAIG